MSLHICPTGRIHNTKSEPQGKLRSFCNYNMSLKVHPWLKKYHSGCDADNGGYACMGVGAYRKSLYLPLNFGANIKVL